MPIPFRPRPLRLSVLPALLLLLMALLSMPIASAQTPAAAKPAAKPATGTTEAPPAAPAPIPAANVVARAESEENTLNILQTKLQQLTQQGSMKLRLQRLNREAGETRVRSQLAMESDSQRRMRDIEPAWGQLHTEITQIDKQLTQSAEGLQEHFDRLNQMQKTWEDTLAADEIGQAPAVVKERIQAVLTLIQETRKIANRSRSAIFDLQAQSAKLQALVNTEQAQLRNTLTASIDSLFMPDSPAFFGPSQEAKNADAQATTGLTRLRNDGETILAYLKNRPTRSGTLAAFFILLYGLLSWLRPRIEQKISRQPALRSVRWLLDAPLAVSVLATATLAVILLPYPPSSLSLLLVMLALLPTVLLLRKVVEPYLATYLHWLLALYAFNQVPDVFRFNPSWERVFFQVQLLVTIGLLLHLQRNRNKALEAALQQAAEEDATISSEALPPEAEIPAAPSEPEKQSLTLTGRAIMAVMTGCIAALVSNVLGFTRLAHFISEATLNSLFYGMILFAGALVLLSLLRLAFNLRPLNQLKMLGEDGTIIETRIRKGVYWGAILIWLGLTLNQTMLLSPLIDWVRSVLSAQLRIGQVALSLADIFSFLLIIWGAIKVSQLLRYVLDREVFTRISLPPGIPYALNSVLNYVVLIGGLLLAIASTGISLDRFTIFASALGVGVGFGLQSIVNNFVSGLIVLFERPIKVGDSVDMAGQSGRVKRIGIRASILRTGAGADVIVPNSQLISNQVVNWTLSDLQRRIEITINVGYDADPKQVIQLLVDVAREQADILATPAPHALFTDFGSDAMQFKLYAWTARGDRLGGIRSEMCIALHSRLKENDIRITAG
ncbi:MAG: mechanosensitive ion channel [Lautropia sp.]|nr:mechanosensitive ion channel [Lautropia sp.]